MSMALQIANPVGVGKVERLAKAAGLSKTALVERTLARTPTAATLAALLAQLDRIPDRADVADVLQWDRHGLAA